MSYLKQYEYVITVAAKGGISNAAEALQIAQPTLSRYIKKLETDLGIELFDRSTIPIRLTKAGELYVEMGRHMLDLDRQLQKQLQEYLLNRRKEIRIGVSPSRAPYLMPSIIALFKKIHPICHVIIDEDITAELNKKLLQGDVDLIISLMDEETLNFERVALFEEEMLLAVPKGAAFCCDSVIDILRTAPLINVGKGQALWQLVNDVAQIIGIREPEIECHTIESALALVKRGIGVMIVPSYISRYGSEELNQIISFLPLSIQEMPGLNGLMKRKICLFYRKEQFLSEVERDFIKCAQSVVNSDTLAEKMREKEALEN